MVLLLIPKHVQCMYGVEEEGRKEEENSEGGGGERDREGGERGLGQTVREEREIKRLILLFLHHRLLKRRNRATLPTRRGISPLHWHITIKPLSLTLPM